MLERVGVDLVLDAGASDGGFASELRDVATGGRILSFEPSKLFRPPFSKAKRMTSEGSSVRVSPEWMAA